MGTLELRALARTKMFRVYHGKHKGATFEDVMHNDRSYVHSSLGPLVPLATQGTSRVTATNRLGRVEGHGVLALALGFVAFVSEIPEAVHPRAEGRCTHGW